MNWFGGKPAGTIWIGDNNCQVSFSIGGRGERKYTSQCFSYNKYGSSELAQQTAKEWREGESLRKNLTKNLIRIIERETGPPPYLEIQMQNGMVMKCDVEDIELVEDSVWTAWRGQDKKCWYARRQASKKLNQEYAMFHSLVCPNYIQVDHINRDGLDNRRCNLREGVIVNPRNKGIQVNNISGVTGVYYQPGPKSSWRAQIGSTGNRRKKSFSVELYGHDGAKRMAIKTRREWERELDYY